MQKFEGTEIEIRLYGKSELASKLGVSRSTMTRYLKQIETTLQPKGYSRHQKTLAPVQVQVFLLHYGYL